MPDKKPNILVIVTDQHRRDVNGAYGSQLCRTPSIDRLAESGSRFDQAYSICALCTPARASMFTGIVPHRHGLIRNSEDPFCKTEFTANDKLISEYLKPVGYKCEFVGKWHCGIKRTPEDFGFEGMNVPGYGDCRKSPEYEHYLQRNNLTTGEIVPIGGGWRRKLVLAGKDTGPTEASIPYFIAEETIRHLRDHHKDSESPFLLFANFWGPHAPYVPTEPYASMYNPTDIEQWENFDEDFSRKPQAHKRYRDAFIGHGAQQRSWDECAQWAALYFGFVTMIDEQIGRIVNEVERLGLADDTVIIFTTDHGDLLGAHGGMHDKCSIMCQETYHIPFIVRVPGITGGKTVSTPITNMDLMPTLLGLAGVEPDRPLDGRSLVPLLRGEADSGRNPFAICEFNGHHYHYQARMITNGQFKYVVNAPESDEFYDLGKDSWETDNLIDSETHQAQIREFRQALLDWMEKSNDPLLTWATDIYGERRQKFTPYQANHLGRKQRLSPPN